MKAVLVQPPFVQLNAPYPAIHYLEAFLKGCGHEARAYDHSIVLYRLLFSRQGLTKVFADVEERLASAKAEAAVGVTAEARAELERYLSYRELYLEWIDGLVDFLAGGDPGFAHRLASAAEFPRGARASAFVEACGGRIGLESARELATKMLEDLGDLIGYALDPDFATVRYGDRLARSQGDFGEVLAALESGWFLREVYGPWLKAFWAARAAELGGHEDLLILITIPFPGCLAGALACARTVKAALGPRARIAFGGGYVSTELRDLKDPRIFSFCEWLSFDAGYGSLASILASLGHPGPGADAQAGLYRTMVLGPQGGVRAEGFPGAGGDQSPYTALERQALETVFPDYASADFPSYLGVVDSDNPMHRLWSDTPWLKFSLAHGCYWKRCAFCDTQLDYVKNFVPARLEPLLEALDSASARHGLYGVHFVDEALPMKSLLAFADANGARAGQGKRPFHYWGNVRFDATWTEDRCAYLASRGLVAVSGGIEIATEAGLAMTDKGFDLPSLVRTLVAMRRAGLLVHAYLIYGFPGQEGGDILDSAEVVRQLFASGLIDSGFWHRFVLTRGSRMMADYAAGKRPDLVPIDRAGSFADNDLEFKGEALFDPWDGPLAAALEAWMGGRDLEAPAASLLAGLGLRKPGRSRIAEGLIEALIARAEAELDASRPESGRMARWAGGLPRLSRAGPLTRLAWAFRGGMEELLLPEARAKVLASALEDLARKPGEGDLAAFYAAAGLEAGSPEALSLHGAGLLAL